VPHTPPITTSSKSSSSTSSVSSIKYENVGVTVIDLSASSTYVIKPDCNCLAIKISETGATTTEVSRLGFNYTNPTTTTSTSAEAFLAVLIATATVPTTTAATTSSALQQSSTMSTSEGSQRIITWMLPTLAGVAGMAALSLI